MTLGVLDRMMECTLSVEVLALKGRPRDAAVLVLTLMELRLDLQYAAQDSTRASVWLANADKGRKPWRVGAQIRAISQDLREREAELANVVSHKQLELFFCLFSRARPGASRLNAFESLPATL